MFPHRGEGSSFDKAIILMGATSSLSGVPAEYEWLRDNLSGCRKTRQLLTSHNDKMYDAISCRYSDGRSETVYFDITGFFGKIFRKR